jgi:hypothetical protein
MIFTNFMVGLPLMLLCLAIQALVSFWSIRYYIRRVRGGERELRLGTGLLPLLVVMLTMMSGTLVQVILWGALFVGLGEFSEYYEAIYHSAVNFGSLGYGDIVMQKQWKMLGPLEAINGVLMLGMTAATLMVILQHMVKTQLNKR